MSRVTNRMCPKHRNRRSFGLVHGKLAVDAPSFSSDDLRKMNVCRRLRQYLTDGAILDSEDNSFRKSLLDMARTCFLKGDVLYTKRCGIIREIAVLWVHFLPIISVSHMSVLLSIPLLAGQKSAVRPQTPLWMLQISFTTISFADLVRQNSFSQTMVLISSTTLSSVSLRFWRYVTNSLRRITLSPTREQGI
jgi:hypothetical protein